jgi:4-hydroxy-tetrahydrodipicolinate synthase
MTNDQNHENQKHENTVRKALRGISGVHVTAWGADGEADWAVTAKIVARIAAAGIHNIVSAGNTGEFYPMTTDEVVRSHAVAAQAVAGKALVTAGIGRSLREAVSTGKLAATAGCDAVMVHHPLDPFAAPQSQADYIIAIAEALTLPVVAYIRSDAIGVKDLVRVATHANVAGVKFASTNMMLLAECVRATQGTSANWICGLAEGWAAPFYALGARGFTSGLVNVAPERSLADLACAGGATMLPLASRSARSPASRLCARNTATAPTSPWSRKLSACSARMSAPSACPACRN